MWANGFGEIVGGGALVGKVDWELPLAEPYKASFCIGIAERPIFHREIRRACGSGGILWWEIEGYNIERKGEVE